MIDYIALEHIGVINSQTHFSIPDDVETSMQIPDAMAILGQPFYIDSLFFGCEFPATDNRIQYGIGQVKYYVVTRYTAALPACYCHGRRHRQHHGRGAGRVL